MEMYQLKSIIYYFLGDYKFFLGGSILNRKNIQITPIILLAIAFVMTLNQTLMVTSLPSLMETFQVSVDLAQWVTTGYILFLGLVIPFSAAIMLKFKTRMITQVGLIVFVVASVIGMLGQSIWVVIAARIIQGLCAGIMLPLMQYAFLLAYPKESRGRAMGYVMLAQSFAPAIGPTLAGFIVVYSSWRMLFTMMIPITVVLLGVSFFGIREFSETKKVDIPITTILLSTVGFGSILLGSGMMSQNIAVALLFSMIGLVSLSLFIRQQYRLDNPTLNFSVFQFPKFRVATIVSVLVFALLISTEMLLPIFVVSIKQETEIIAGLILLPGVIVFSLLSPTAGKVYDRYGAKPLAIVGLSIIVLTTVYFIFLTKESSLILITILYAIRLGGISFLIVPLMAESMNSLPEKLLAHGTAMSNTLSQTGAAIVSSFVVSIITLYPMLLSGIQMAFIALLLIGVFLLGFVSVSSVLIKK